MLFEQKKIQIETLGEYLMSVRNNLKLSVEAVGKKTGIKIKSLTGLESGDFKILPPDVYVLGFLRQLAQLYHVDAEILIEQFKKETGIQKQITQQLAARQAPWPKKYWQKLVVTPKILSLGLGLAFVVVTVGYIVWEVWSINKIPVLEISTPVNNAVITSGSVTIGGKTDPGMIVTVNGQNLFVNDQGGFQTQLGLSPGLTEITIIAKNRFGKQTGKTLDIIGAAVAPADTGQLELKISFSADVSLGFAIDDGPIQQMDFNAGDTKTFLAKNRILLSTSDAGATKITLNGQALGPLGRPKEQLNNIPFFLQQTNPAAESQ